MTRPFRKGPRFKRKKRKKGGQGKHDQSIDRPYNYPRGKRKTSDEDGNARSTAGLLFTDFTKRSVTRLNAVFNTKREGWGDCGVGVGVGRV